MKVFIILLTLTSSAVMAEGEAKKSMQERKARAIKSIDARIEGLTSLKACVNAASKKGDLLNCRKKHREKMEPMRKEWKSKRKERKAQRKARKENKDS